MSQIETQVTHPSSPSETPRRVKAIASIVAAVVLALTASLTISQSQNGPTGAGLDSWTVDSVTARLLLESP